MRDGDGDDVDIVARAIAILDEEVRAWYALRDGRSEPEPGLPEGWDGREGVA